MCSLARSSGDGGQPINIMQQGSTESQSRPSSSSAALLVGILRLAALHVATTVGGCAAELQLNAIAVREWGKPESCAVALLCIRHGWFCMHYGGSVTWPHA
jgi:hypothetical protein